MSLYDDLGILEEATFDEVKLAYKRLASQLCQ